jgi:hypothetical protein
VSLLFSCKDPKQETVVCNFANYEYNNSALEKKTDPDYVEGVINIIMDYTGLPKNFELEEVNWGNAAAFIVYSKDGYGKRKITYQPDFFLKVNDSTGNYWASISILSHEIGHHLSGHTEANNSNNQFEIEADVFSGFILNRMGASLEDARIAVSTVSKWNKGIGLGEQNRIKAIENGWLQAEKTRDQTLSIPGKYPYVSVRHLSKEDLIDVDLWDLRIMLNEVYARKGYKFNKEPDMYNYFNTLAWYHQIPPSKYEAQLINKYLLSPVEKENLQLIQYIINQKNN